MNKTMVFAPVLVFSFFLGSCATSQKIAPVQPGDNRLSCSQLQAEFRKLDLAQDDVRSKQGMTGTNVAAAIFWLPGLYYTFYDASQALEAISDRRTHLTAIFNEKDC